MSDEKMVCRLCLNTRFLKDLFKIGGICSMITSVTGLMFEQDDGLPTVICLPCERNIKYFNRFKQTCLDVDSKLRSKFTTQTCNNIKHEFDVNIKIESKDDSEVTLNETETKYGNIVNLENNLTDVKHSDSSLMEEKKHDIFKNVKEKQRNFQCDMCGNVYKNKCSLSTHIITHTGVKKYSCPMCPKTFTREAHKVVHLRAHMGIKPFVCEICGMSTTKRQDLNRHLLVHSDERKYPCPECDKRFKRSSDVHTHMRTHTGARPFKCNECDKGYKSHGALQKHYRTHCRKEPNKNKIIKKNIVLGIE